MASYPKEHRECIFLWSRGGGGHRAVMDAKKQEWSEKSSYILIDKDIMGEGFLNDFYFPFLGRLGDFCVNRWDNAQTRGNVFFLKILSGLQGLAEVLFHPLIYSSLKKMLLARSVPVECVIDSQPICTLAIAKAIYDVNKIRGWNIRLDLWMTDMPTDKALHFFSSLKRLGEDPELSPLITLYAPPTYHASKEEEEKFWGQYCGQIKVVTDQPFPIRKRFLSQQCLLGKEVELKIVGDEEESSFFSIKAEDKVATLMLGSHPSHRAVLEYIDVMVNVAQEHPELDEDKNEGPLYYFFVFCGSRKGASHATDLLKKVETKLHGLSYPKRLKIIPFTFLGDEDLAPLMARSDLTLTRSGGSTCMELLHLNKQNKRLTLIHSEVEEFFSESPKERSKKFFFGKKELQRVWFARPFTISMEKCLKTFGKTVRVEQDDLLHVEKKLLNKGILLWEAGNAEYLQEMIGAKVVSPRHIQTVLKDVFFCSTAEKS